MKTTRLIVLPALMLGLLHTFSAQADDFRDNAPVISSTPVYERVNLPRRQCWTEQVGYERPRQETHDYGGAILGGIVGGLLGNTVGKGDGRRLATAIGAATGAMAGDRIDNDESGRGGYGRPRYVERCRNEDQWTQRLTGYNVVYRYNGHDYTSFMPYDPGQTVKVRIDVSLAERF